MKLRNILLFIAVGAIAAGTGIFLSQRNTPSTQQAHAVTNLLAQTMPDVKGQPQALSKWQGKPLIINFWATWCAPCVEEMPELAALQAEIAPVQIIGIGVDTQANIAQFAEKMHIYYPLYVAGTNATDLLRQLGNQAGGLPFTILIGMDGSLKKVYLGRLNFDDLRRDLASLKK
jgi:thiol-disulfide isomerase/thioredoxin